MGTGWQQHPVCTRRFHFIIPSSSERAPLLEAGGGEGTGHKECSDGPECDSPYVAPASAFDSHEHLLHGVLHANGFGHLLRINGLEGGSSTLTGMPSCLHYLASNNHASESTLRASMCAASHWFVWLCREANHGHLGSSVRNVAGKESDRGRCLQQGIVDICNIEPDICWNIPKSWFAEARPTWS